MAVREVRVDDLDGNEGASLREFSLDGQDYVIDLTDANHAKLRKALEKYIEFGTKVSPARRAIKAPTTRHTHVRASAGARGPSREAIREWAKKNGFENVSSRGRVRRDIQDAYDAAHAANNGEVFSHAGK